MTRPIVRNAGGLTAYDTVPYLSGARSASSVGRLSMLGRLLGMAAADPHRCRVLELGCGDAGNIIPMAVSFPGSEFVGIDLASTAIERANERIAAVGADNISLFAGSFGDVDATFGSFDYVIAHGVYSWVPAPARQQLLAAIRARLRPHGLAFVSYNARPGGQIRGVLRDMMLMHTRAITDPHEKIKQARALLSMLAQSANDEENTYRVILNSEVGKALASSDSLLYHDDLAEVSEPFFFSDFMADASRHGLQFASEANFHQMSLIDLPAEIASALARLAATDLLAKEQYLDFIVCRGFRQTVLCREEAALDRAIDAGRVRQFRFRTRATRAGAGGPGELAEFRGPDRSSLRTDSPFAVTALTHLSEAFPRTVDFDQLASVASCTSATEQESLAEVLFAAFSAGVVEFHVADPAVVFDASERPIASPWARYQAEAGRVVNLFHEIIGVTDTAARVLEAMDGTRTVFDVAEHLGIDEGQARSELAELLSRALMVG